MEAIPQTSIDISRQRLTEHFLATTGHQSLPWEVRHAIEDYDGTAGRLALVIHMMRPHGVPVHATASQELWASVATTTEFIVAIGPRPRGHARRSQALGNWNNTVERTQDLLSAARTVWSTQFEAEVSVALASVADREVLTTAQRELGTLH